MEHNIYHMLGSKQKRLKVILYIAISFVIAIGMLPTEIVKAKMLPSKSANTYSIYIDTATNSSINQTKGVTNCIVSYYKNEPNILNMQVYLAQGAPLDYAGLVKGSDFKQLPNQAEIVINLTNKHHREETSFAMVHRIRPKLKEACGDIYKNTSIRFIEMPSGPPTLATIVVNLVGKNRQLLRKTASRVSNVLSKTEGLVDVDIMQDDIYDKFEITLNKEKIVRSGLSVEQVNNILYLAFKGMVITVKNSHVQQDQIGIFIQLNKESREVLKNTIESLQRKLSSLRLMNRMGMMIPIKEIVDIKIIDSSPTIFRKNLKEQVTITAECDLVSQLYPLLDARSQLIEILADKFKIELESGLSTYMFDLHLTHKETGEKILLRWDGEMKVSLDTFRDLGGAFIAALTFMFLLMVMYYKSFAISGVILLGSFLSIIGVIIGHYITDLIAMSWAGVHFFLTATSLIGFISLMGISARSSLLLIDFAMELIKKGVEKRRAIAISTSTRAKPILMTAVAIILGSLLLATDPIFGGLGIALIFGSIASTIVSLYLVPIMILNVNAICPNGKPRIKKDIATKGYLKSKED
jgi:multidrug efflux pump subunit AcrB